MRIVPALVVAASATLSGLLGSASASVSINQPFTAQPSDWTSVTTNTGTVGFTGGQLTIGGFTTTQNASDLAYEEYTTPGTMSYTTSGSARSGQLTVNFDVTFNTTNTTDGNTSADRGSDGLTIFSIFGGGNNSVATLGIQPYGYGSGPQYVIGTGGGIFYGGGNSVASTGEENQTFPAADFDGQTFHVVLTSVITDTGPDSANPGNDLWSITNNATMSNSANTFTFGETTDGDTSTGSFDPLDANLQFQLGNAQNVTYGGGFGDGTQSPTFTGSLGFGNFTATDAVVPEPATAGLLVISAVGALVRRRRAVVS